MTHPLPRPIPRHLATTAPRVKVNPARWALLTGVALLAGVAGVPRAQAQNNPEMGRVLSSVPVIQQTAVPRQVCSNEQVTVPGQKSGAGAVLGGVAGGAIGNQIGGGSGRAAATMLGIVGGAMLGNSIEGGGPPQTQWVQRCTTQTVYENQTVGYNVTYEYAGKTYTVQMPQDPGPWVRLQVSPVAPPPSGYPPYGPPATYFGPQSGNYPLDVQPSVTYVTPPVYTQETTYIAPAPVYARPAPAYVRPYPVVVPPSASIHLNWSNQRDNDHWRHDRDRGGRHVYGVRDRDGLRDRREVNVVQDRDRDGRWDRGVRQHGKDPSEFLP